MRAASPARSGGAFDERHRRTGERFRGALIPSFAQGAVPSPRPTSSRRPRPPCPAGRARVWVKRGDVHNTCARDVVFARDASEFSPCARNFQRREIADLLSSARRRGPHQFYGVGPGQWFTWFYHDASDGAPAALSSSRSSPARRGPPRGHRRGDLRRRRHRSRRRPIFLIDINSWPSFGRSAARPPSRSRGVCAPVCASASPRGSSHDDGRRQPEKIIRPAAGLARARFSPRAGVHRPGLAVDRPLSTRDGVRPAAARSRRRGREYLDFVAGIGVARSLRSPRLRARL